jgi:DNA-binding transcriptional regulator YhcF (GntR family)/predicted GIY-YIG superfamily endonuclease
VSERTALYRLYDVANRLLYIGIAKDPEVRWRGHADSPTSPWWPQVERKEFEWFPSREAADEAETVAIATEQPLHNRAKVAMHRRPSYGFWGIRSQEINRARANQIPLSQQVANVLRADITEGRIRPGDQMPSGRMLFRRFGVTENTCYLALRRLADEGLCFQPRPRGRFVCTDPTAGAQPSTHAPSPIPVGDESLVYRTFRFAVNHPAKGAAQIRSKMSDEQWSAFVAAVAEIDGQPRAA